MSFNVKKDQSMRLNQSTRVTFRSHGEGPIMANPNVLHESELPLGPF